MGYAGNHVPYRPLKPSTTCAAYGRRRYIVQIYILRVLCITQVWFSDCFRTELQFLNRAYLDGWHHIQKRTNFSTTFRSGEFGLCTTGVFIQKPTLLSGVWWEFLLCCDHRNSFVYASAEFVSSYYMRATMLNSLWSFSDFEVDVIVIIVRVIRSVWE